MDGNYERDLTLWSQEEIIAKPHDELILNLNIKASNEIQTDDTIRAYSNEKLSKDLEVIDCIDKVRLEGNSAGAATQQVTVSYHYQRKLRNSKCSYYSNGKY